MYIYLDESGDLGFALAKPGASRYFIITLLCCHTKAARRAFAVAIRRTVKNKIKPKKKGFKKHKELKGTNTSPVVKSYFYRQIKSDDWRLYTVILNKRRVYDQFHSTIGQSRIYNFLSRFIIERLPLIDTAANVRLVVDKSKNRAEILDFNRYLCNYVEGMLPLNTGFRVDHLNSHEDPVLQAVDMFSWGIARKYKLGDTQWYDVFRGKIAYEDVYLPE